MEEFRRRPEKEIHIINDNNPPKKVIELSGWIAAEVHKTLIKEGFDVGDYAVCVMNWTRGIKDKQIRKAEIMINFCYGKKPKDILGGDIK